jgi:leader peptidase (prepilin peptidase)/N-methyltransferase
MSVIFSLHIPEFFLVESYVVAFLLGAIIGSFLNVYIYRFHTGKSLAGSSHCLSCGSPLKWFELFPIFSYLAIRGRCRHCHSKVPFRYFVVELLTGAVGGLMLQNYFIYGVPGDVLVFDFFIALVGSAFFMFLWLISKGEWLGFGDVKLAFPLGWLVGASSVFSFVVLSFWIGALVSLLILGLQKYQRGKSHLRLLSAPITMKSAVPFAPFLIAGALVTFFANLNVLDFFTFTF